MSNPFSLRSAAVGSPLGVRLNSELITLTFNDATTRRGRAIVDISDPQPAIDGKIEVEGKLTILTSDVEKYITPRGVPMQATARGTDWHIYGQSPDQFGLTMFLIRRQYAEQDQTNMFDMNDRQATWSG